MKDKVHNKGGFKNADQKKKISKPKTNKNKDKDIDIDEEK